MTTTAGLIPNWYPPNQENYHLILSLWQWYPAFASLQWFLSWYGMGKTSVPSSLFNLPGRPAWLTMEIPGFLSLLYTLSTLPPQLPSTPSSGLPYQNKILASLFVIHYLYRAILYPLIAPSMSPIHLLVWFSALTFQVTNGVCIGAFLSGYGPSTSSEWAAYLSPFPTLQFSVGIIIFYLGLLANYYHDDELRNIRRREMDRQARVARESGKKDTKGVDKHYEIPQAGLFKIMLFPHYFVEWIEWFGFWVACGWGCVPARCFFVNEVASMLPRAVSGKKWYVEKFGEEKIGKKWAAIPGVW